MQVLATFGAGYTIVNVTQKLNFQAVIKSAARAASRIAWGEPRSRCPPAGAVVLAFARIEGMDPVCTHTKKQKTISKRHFFLLEKCFEDVRQDEKHVPDLLKR